MMKLLFCVALAVVSPLLIAQEHVHPTEPVITPEIEHAHHMATAEADHTDHELSAPLDATQQLNHTRHGDSTNWLIMADRFEYANADADTMQWEMQGWFGKDFHKLWFKTEGAYDTDANATEKAEVQLLYSRAVAPFWDLQFGLRHDEGTASSRDYAVLGIFGLAPYWFELDAAAFVSEQGKLSTRVEVEYELRFSQRLILQPRVELGYAFVDDAAAGVWQGLHDFNVGLRLRYEIRREFAPYAGVEWSQAHGRTGAELERSGRDSNEFRIVAGVRMWY